MGNRPGSNFVRLAHYPHNEYMVREAEKMGLLVWSEIPVIGPYCLRMQTRT